jgi:hypothetical protein
VGGIFSKANRPKLPGAYFNFVAAEKAIVPVQTGTVVAIPFTHDWGPFELNVRVASFAEFQAIYGDSDDTAGYRAVRQAFVGEGLPGRGGAGEIVCHRFGDANATKATITLQNTTPVAAITLTAKYEGTRGNDLAVTTQDNPADAAQTELILYDGTAEIERYRFLDADIQSAVDKINDVSNWVDASLDQDGVALGIVASQSLTTGDDGEDTLIAGDWTAMLAAIEVEEFSVYAPFDLTDGGILTSHLTWVTDSNAAGKRFMAVFGGAAAEDIATALARSASLASVNIINLGVGTITDATLGSGLTELDISTSELAPRVAGILAARGEYASLTHARLQGASIKVGASLSDQETAFDEGVTVLASDTHPAAPTHIRTGLTTWTDTDAEADPTKPYLIYRQPKYVRTMQGIESDLTKWAEENIIGLRPINAATREAIIAEVKRSLREREQLGAIQPGWTAGIDQDPPPTDEDEFIALAISVKFGRSLEQVYFTVTVG